MMKLGNLMRGTKNLVGFVNSAIMHGEYYVKIFGTKTSLVFTSREALDEWLEEMNLQLA